MNASIVGGNPRPLKCFLPISTVLSAMSNTGVSFLKLSYFCLLRHCPRLILLFPWSFLCLLWYPLSPAGLHPPQRHANPLFCSVLDSVFQCPTWVTLIRFCMSHHTSVEPVVSWVILTAQTWSRSMLLLVNASTKCDIGRDLEVGRNLKYLGKWGEGRERDVCWNKETEGCNTDKIWWWSDFHWKPLYGHIPMSNFLRQVDKEIKDEPRSFSWPKFCDSLITNTMAK